ncbi:MAG: Hsp20/alpha crystallin family protein [Lachnospiraceae bacterium]|nr:Hsp20/alpha crystallin family protein [Lachnospiraceae bacterium]
MMMPSIFGRDMFDDFFDAPFGFRGTHNSGELMRTDIKDSGNGYEITMNMPGVKKEDVKAELKDGYLTVQATTNSSNEEKDENSRYIRRERYVGSCRRSFYVGEAVEQTDIKAKFEDGTLKLSVPKKEAKPAVEEKRYIAIEG